MKRPAPKKHARGPRGTLVLIASLLIASALVRVGGDVGLVWAQDSAGDNIGADVLATDCKTDEDFRAMLAAFQERETRLEQQEKAMSEKQQALKLADLQIESKLAQLQAAEESLRRTMVLADTAADSDVGILTKVYETMKPKQAAALFEEMTPDFAAGFLGRMRPDAAAGIMAGLSPQAAHTISVVLASRNAGAPSQ